MTPARLARPRPELETERWDAPLHERRLLRWSARHEAAEASSGRLALARLVAAVLAVAALVASWRIPVHRGEMAALAGAAAFVFVALVALHRRVHLRVKRLAARREVVRREHVRASGRWRELEADGSGLAGESTLAEDLQLVGHGSLLQAINRCATPQGELRLARLLLAGVPASDLQSRQAAVAELMSRRGFRERLQAEGLLSRGDRGDVGALSASLLAPSWHDARRWVAPLAAAGVVLTLAQGALGAASGLPTLFWPCVAVQAVIAAALARRLAAESAGLLRREREVAAWSAMVAVVERTRFRSALLVRLRADIAGTGTGTGAGGTRASSDLARLAGILDALGLRGSLMHPVLSALLMWDVLWTARLASWRRECGPSAIAWLAALAELEALASLGGHAASLETPTFPDVSPEGPPFEAEAMTHPLLDPRTSVANDLRLEGGARVLLLSGSNMSGKSTLLRAAGCNAVLALAGGAVHARRLRLRPCALVTSIQVRDDLEQGVSLFYAEVLRLRVILDAVDAADSDAGALPALVLIDEVLRGTNTRERLVAGRSVVARLARSRSAGIVTSHDLALTELEGRVPGVTNAHLREEIEGGRMTFDYHVRPGPVLTTNALAILKLEGIDLEDPGGA